MSTDADLALDAVATLMRSGCSWFEEKNKDGQQWVVLDGSAWVPQDQADALMRELYKRDEVR